MAGIARITDIWVGVCSCHPPLPPIAMGGVIVTGSSNSSSNNLGQARIGDVTIGYCGHPGVIVTGSNVSKANNIGLARLGDAVVGCNIGVISTASPDSTTT